MSEFKISKKDLARYRAWAKKYKPGAQAIAAGLKLITNDLETIALKSLQELTIKIKKVCDNPEAKRDVWLKIEPGCGDNCADDTDQSFFINDPLIFFSRGAQNAWLKNIRPNLPSKDPGYGTKWRHFRSRSAEFNAQFCKILGELIIKWASYGGATVEWRDSDIGPMGWLRANNFSPYGSGPKKLHNEATNLIIKVNPCVFSQKYKSDAQIRAFVKLAASKIDRLDSYAPYYAMVKGGTPFEGEYGEMKARNLVRHRDGAGIKEALKITKKQLETIVREEIHKILYFE